MEVGVTLGYSAERRGFGTGRSPSCQGIVSKVSSNGGKLST